MNGVEDLATTAQTAEALKPIAGDVVVLLFAVATVGAGLLAVAELAVFGAYAIGEALRWPTGPARKPKEASAFYVTLAIPTALGIALNFTSIDPVKGLYWALIADSVVAVPVMWARLQLTAREKVMGEVIIHGPLRVVDWIDALAMATTSMLLVAH